MLSQVERRLLLGFSVIFVFLLMVMTPLRFDHYFQFFLPAHVLRIEPVGKTNDNIEILSFKAEWGSLPAGKIELPYTWQGKPGPNAVLIFVQEKMPHNIRIVWDGDGQIFDLSKGAQKGNVVFRKYFDLDLINYIVYFAFLCCFLFTSVFGLSLIFISIRFLPGDQKSVNIFWLAVPMLVVWGIYLLSFWPGLSSYDTMQQWREAQSGVFTDAHPALDTMFIALVSRLFPTPAAIAIIQIIALAFVTSWGLIELNKNGLPHWAVWTLAFLFAALPVNSMMVITIWKDILYGCAIFALFIQFAKIVMSCGQWLEKKRNLLGLILTSLAASFLRHNGFPVVLASLVILFFPYRIYWKTILGTIMIITAAWFFIRGPFYGYLQVKMYPAFANILFLDHIGAHLKAGTPMDQEDTAYLQSLIPLDKWPYKCYDSQIRNMDGPIPFDTFATPDPRPIRLALKLFLKDPMVDINHMLCAGGLFWRVFPENPIYSIPISYSDRYYGMPNEFGIEPNTLLPQLKFVLPIPSLEKSLLWRPALYLLVLLFLMTVLVFRARSLNILVIFWPILGQTMLMIAINYAADFRYAYATVLAAIFSIGLVFLPSDMLSPKKRTASGNFPHLTD